MNNEYLLTYTMYLVANRSGLKLLFRKSITDGLVKREFNFKFTRNSPGFPWDY